MTLVPKRQEIWVETVRFDGFCKKLSSIRPANDGRQEHDKMRRAIRNKDKGIRPPTSQESLGWISLRHFYLVILLAYFKPSALLGIMYTVYVVQKLYVSHAIAL